MTPDRAGIFGGVDTHKQVHVAAALDAAGRLLATAGSTRPPTAIASSPAGCGRHDGRGVPCGRGGHRILRCEPHPAPRRGRRRGRRGEPPEPPDATAPRPDTVDAEAAARAALSGEAAAKSADGCVEAIRTLSVARRSAQGPHRCRQPDQRCRGDREQVKDLLRGLKTPQMIKICARWRIGVGGAPAAVCAAKRACGHWLAAIRRSPGDRRTRRQLLALCEQAATARRLRRPLKPRPRC